MSYDAYLQYKDENGRFHDIEDTGVNITNNLAEMFEVVLGNPLRTFDKDKVSDIMDTFEDALFNLKKFPQNYKKYEASNGWGTTEGAIHFLESLIKGMHIHQDSYLRVES